MRGGGLSLGEGPELPLPGGEATPPHGRVPWGAHAAPVGASGLPRGGRGGLQLLRALPDVLQARGGSS